MFQSPLTERRGDDNFASTFSEALRSEEEKFPPMYNINVVSLLSCRSPVGGKLVLFAVVFAGLQAAKESFL